MKPTKEFDELTRSIFMELLRSYHDGIGKTHGAYPQKEVVHNLAKEAYFMALEYQRTIEGLNR